MPVSNEDYTNGVLKVVVAQICQTIGFSSVQSTPMEVMTDVLHNYLRETCRLTKEYAELYNRTEPNLDDLELAYRDMKINIADLREYCEFVDPIACPVTVPKYPLPKESHLNFLKPGSQEVITRPTHIPEYLPPMQPPEEEESLVPVVPNAQSAASAAVTASMEETLVQVTEEVLKEEPMTSPNTSFFKKPEGIPSDTTAAGSFKKIKFEEEGRPTREITSVMMTTGGFISPAREGKLPDPKAPIIVPDKRPSPPPAPPVVVPLPVTSMDNKFEEKPKKAKHEEKHEKKPKKTPKVKEPPLPPAPASLPSSSSGGLPKVLPPIPPHSIASSVPSSSSSSSNVHHPPPPPMMKPATPRKPGRPPKIRPDGSITPSKPRKPKDPDAKILRMLKKKMAAGQLPPLNEAELMQQLKNFKENKEKNQSKAAHHHAGPSSHPFGAPQFGMSPKIDKISAEPEKSKLNIFKKMQNAVKLPPAHPPPAPPAHAQEYNSPLLQPKSEPMMHPYETTPPTMKKRDVIDAPNFMQGGGSGSFGRSPMEVPKTPDFMPRTPDVKTSPWIKEEKKKKEKTEKKPKKQPKQIPPPMPPLSAFMNPNLANFAGMNLPFGAGAGVGNDGRFPFFPGILPSGPGLIPNNPFMAGPSFGNPFMAAAAAAGNPAGIPGNPAIPNLFPGLPQPSSSSMMDSQPNPVKNPMIPIQIPPPPAAPPMHLESKSQSQCNVAPLIPQHLPQDLANSIQGSTSQGRSSSPMLKLPPDTIAIPVPQDPPPASSSVAAAPPEILEQRPPSAIPSHMTADEFDTIDLTSPLSSKSEKKKDKEHKKEKKEKDKLKKKKKQKDKDREKGEKSEREKVKKHKKEKKKEKERLDAHKILSSNTDSVDASDSSMASVPKLTLKLGVGSRSSTPDVPKKLSIKPGSSKKKDSDSFSDTFSDIGSSPRPNVARESSPELAKISALVTHPPKKHSSSPKKRKHDDELPYEEKIKSPTKHKKHSSSPHPPPAVQKLPPAGENEEGQKVWICPACAQVDNGTPMIGCDGCDAWYHWVCVGIQVPPDENEDWYCRACISRKQESQGEKKKKRKKNKERTEKV